MAVTLLDADKSLPPSQCFISIGQGRSVRTWRVPRAGLWIGAAGGALLALWLVASSLYLVFHDDLVSALMARQARMQYGYEDRIAALRGEVQHESSLALVNSTTVEAKVRELALRAATLESRASLLADLKAKVGLESRAGAARSQSPLVNAAEPGVRDAVDNPLDEVSGSLPSTALPLSAPATRGKPRPEAMLLPDEAPHDAAAAPSMQIRLASLTEALERVDAAQYDRLAEIGRVARHRSEALRTALASAGLAPERFQAKDESAPMGGPFVPLAPAIEASPFGRALTGLQADIVASTRLSGALPRLPFAKPLDGAMEVTSGFGARLDPFLGRPAMHTGVDLREGYGTAVRATAAGRVVSAGPAGGYGTMVEIDHGHGLSTRYAHLSSVSVAPGQSVAKGEVVGEVGASGRATGPHLHYETRIDGEAVDPMRFLLAGERLLALNVAP